MLKTFPGFATLDSAQIAVLASITHERTFEPGEVLHEPGKTVLAFYLIVSGEVQLYRDGRPAKVFGPRSSVGGLSALTKQDNHAVALTEVLALEVDADDMDEVFEDHYPILVGVLRALAGTLREVQIQRGGGASVKKTTHVRPPPQSPLNLVERMFFFRQTSNFAHASIEALADLVQDVPELRYEPGQTLWEAGESASYSVIVLDGVIECTADGVEPFDFDRGYVVGGLDALSQTERWYDARAKTKLRVLQLHTAHMFDVLEDHVDMAMTLVRTLAEGVQAMLAALAAQELERQSAANAASGQGEQADE
ncbi:MAG: cyclic nucleotide-binding domain-containing protein [Polyangiaceae bacterium]